MYDLRSQRCRSQTECKNAGVHTTNLSARVGDFREVSSCAPRSGWARVVRRVLGGWLDDWLSGFGGGSMLMTNWMMIVCATSSNTSFVARCVRLNGLHFAEAIKHQSKFAPPSQIPQPVYIQCNILKSARSFIYSRNRSNNGDEI